VAERYAQDGLFLISHIVEFEDSSLPAAVLENKRVWNSLPLEIAIYYSTLDKYTIEDEFFIALGSKGVQRLSDAKLDRLGDLVALPAHEVAQRASLSPRERHRLERVIRGFGLHFEADVDAWRAYRATMPANFRLIVPYQTRLPAGTRRALDT
jgi:hypothetical protein